MFHGPNAFVVHPRIASKDLGRSLRRWSSGGSKEIPYWTNLLSPLRRVPLLPNINDGSDNQALSLPAEVRNAFDGPPSVSKILRGSMDDEAAFKLRRWEIRTKEELGAEQFKRLRRETLNRGISFHALVHRFLADGVEPDPERVSPADLRLYESALPQLRDMTGKYVTGEVCSTHPALFYRAKIDSLVVDVDGAPTLVEWKTSSKPKTRLADTYDAPLQAAACLGAFNHDPPSTRLAVGRPTTFAASLESRPSISPTTSTMRSMAPSCSSSLS